MWLWLVGGVVDVDWFVVLRVLIGHGCLWVGRVADDDWLIGWLLVVVVDENVVDVAGGLVSFAR